MCIEVCTSSCLLIVPDPVEAVLLDSSQDLFIGEIMDLPWPFQLPYYTAKPGEPMPTFGAVEVADERLRPTPTPEEQEELDRFAALEGPEAAEKLRLKMGVQKPEPETPTRNEE